MSFAACEPLNKVIAFFANDGTGHVFKYAIDRSPETLDPQLAEDKSSVAVLKNLFAGLMDYDSSGRLVGRMAYDYVVSQDELTYTFYLKEGYKWHAIGNYETDVTAGDFVFGFRRLFNPETESPHASKYLCISGAAAALKGDISAEEIGVRAVDDYTVEFTLEYRNAEFLYLLAELPAMPCCQDYFEKAGGKYGLEADAICTNGPFFVRYWLHDPYGSDNYIRLRRNPGYSDVEPVSPLGVNFLVTKSADERLNDYNNGSTEAILFESGSRADTDSSYICGYTDTVGLIFNQSKSHFSNEEIRQLFSWAIDRETLAEKSPETLKPASSIIPDSPVISARGYKSSISPEITVSDLSMAEYKWNFILDDRQKSELIGRTIMVPSDFGYADCLNALTDSWYDILGINFGIEIVNEGDYLKRLESGDYDIALVTLGNDSSTILEFLTPFGGENKFGITLDEVKAAEEDSGKYTSLSTYNYRCSEAESAIVSGYHFIPLWHAPTVLCFDEDAVGLELDVYSRAVIFKDAKKF